MQLLENYGKYEKKMEILNFLQQKVEGIIWYQNQIIIQQIFLQKIY